MSSKKNRTLSKKKNPHLAWIIVFEAIIINIKPHKIKVILPHKFFPNKINEL